jgi:hypothetical protein
MKRNLKPFSIEIKKTRVRGQRSDLPPKRLFATTLAEATKIFRMKEPQAVADPVPVPRILPSILGPVWSSSEPVEPVRRKRSSMKVSRGHLEFNLEASASRDVEAAHAEVPLSAKTVPQVDSALDYTENELPVPDVQPAQGKGMRAKSQRPPKKDSGAIEQEIASDPTSEAAITVSSVLRSSKVVQNRLTRRAAAAAHLPRHERWKGRLHPAAW